MLNTVPPGGGWMKTRDLRHFLENKSAWKPVWRRLANDEKPACQGRNSVCMNRLARDGINQNRID